MNDVTQILSQIEQGDPSAAEQLLPLLYDELRKLAAAKLAHEKPGQTLQATALVHEAYLRLVDVENAQQWDGHCHFLAAAAEAMRRILIENARRKGRVRHGGEFERVSISVDKIQAELDADQILALDEALELLAEQDPVKARLVVLHFFGGLTMKQAADVLEISRATAHRYWIFARAWLFRQIAGNSPRAETESRNPEPET